VRFALWEAGDLMSLQESVQSHKRAGAKKPSDYPNLKQVALSELCRQYCVSRVFDFSIVF